ncbi:hypothetical protein CMT37_05010 [Elizabethkingia anophelis]|nr:hypothetical protein [Elizabethkingia anophelis]
MKNASQNNEISKREYIAPSIEVTFIEMEYGIAAGSATLDPGNLGSPNTPQTEDWQDNNPVNKDYDV